jgi:cytochrome b subunit of formate dehydrogenase
MVKRILFSVGLIIFIIAAWVLWNMKFGALYSPFQVFRDSRWIFIFTAIAGAAAGIIAGLIKMALRSKKTNQTARHTIDTILEHWGTAAGIFILIVSGVQLHYFHGGLPAIKLHFLGIFFTLLFGTYFLADFFVSLKYRTLLPGLKDIIDGTIKKYLFRFKFKETGKYLASQKASFLLFAAAGAVILITGIIKLLFFYIKIPFRLLETATKVHDISAWIFGIVLVIHILLAAARRSNWPLLSSWFNGKNPPDGRAEIKTSGLKAENPVKPTKSQ